jgi:hypothetical protein
MVNVFPFTILNFPIAWSLNIKRQSRHLTIPPLTDDFINMLQYAAAFVFPALPGVFWRSWKTPVRK